MASGSSNIAGKAVNARQPFPVPWGLFIVLAAYSLLVLGYVWATYWNSPEYQAAKGYAHALRLLGVDDGRKCSQAELEEAFDLVAEAARLVPTEHGLAEHLERLRWRFDERKFPLSVDRKHRSEFISVLAKKEADARKAWLVIGSRDKGWAADQLLAGPQTTVLWSTPGFVVILVVWAWLRFTGRNVSGDEKEKDLRQQEAHLKELGRFREGLGNQGVEPEDDGEDTIAEAPKPRPRVPTSGGRPAVARPPTSGGRPAVRRPPTSPGRPAVPRPPTSGGRPAVKKKPPEE